MDPFGFTRASVQSDHALITPDTHVSSPLMGWNDATAVVHISPAMGARFTQLTATLEPGATSDPPLPGVERFIYVQQGQVELKLDSASPTTVRAGGYAWLPKPLLDNAED